MDQKRRFEKSKTMFTIATILSSLSACNTLEKKSYLVTNKQEAKELRERNRKKKGIYQIILDSKEESRGETIINW